MSSGMERKLMSEIQSGVQEMVQERMNDEVSRIQVTDITRAATLLDANVEEETIEKLLCKYWDLRSSQTPRFICEGEEERKI